MDRDCVCRGRSFASLLFCSVVDFYFELCLCLRLCRGGEAIVDCVSGHAATTPLSYLSCLGWSVRLLQLLGCTLEARPLDYIVQRLFPLEMRMHGSKCPTGQVSSVSRTPSSPCPDRTYTRALSFPQGGRQLPLPIMHRPAYVYNESSL